MTNYQKNVGIQPLKTFLARAIYDNLSENPTELNFSRGDIITVLDRNPSGLNGWWVCSIRGQLGIAPGNRLELLGLINNNKEQNNSDVYDDPTGWCIPNDNNNDDNNPNNSKNSIVCTKKSTQFNPLEENHLSMNHNSCSLYENVDYYTKYSSSVGLTDSGNFSNQSSDVSFSTHSINDGIVDQRMNRENSYEDYEDLPPSIPEEFRDTNNSIKFESTNTNPYKNETTVNNLHYTTNSSKQLNNEILFSLNTQNKSTNNIINSVDNLNHKKFSENSLYSSTEINNEKQFKSLLELTPNIFRTIEEFTEYWLPIQQRIHDKCLNLIKVLNKHDQMHSTHLITSLFTQLNNEFIIISQLCTVMIGLSKQTTLNNNNNNNLTQKFIISRHNMENLAELFIKLSKRINIIYLNNQYQKYNKQSNDTTHLTNNNNSSNDSNNHNNIDESKTLLEQTIQQLITEINLFYTTILVNSNILFNNSINKSSKLNQKHFSLIKQQTNIFNKLCKSIPSFNTPILDLSLKLTNDKQKYLSKSLEFINHLNNINHKNFLRNLNFQKLSQFCLNSLYIIDNYLNYLIQFQNDTILYFKNLKNNNIFIHSIIEQTKLIMESCNQLIRYIMSICNEFKSLSSSSSFTLSSIYNINDNHDTNTVVLINLFEKLEYMTDKLCESLKSLIILTKEIAKFLTNEYEIILCNKIIPIPGPLLQRLNGALKSVQNSIKTIHELINE
ncbi:unnamed protein product [Schistosoma spindalis]|nr:unnamed protein product [Schistosoma spindale]